MNLRNRFKPIFLVVMTIFLLLSSVAAAAESTPDITGFTPSEGASVNAADLTIKFDVTDPDNISSTNSDRYIKLNGAAVNSDFLYEGVWIEDSCGDYYYEIASTATAHISANAAGLADGSQSVEVMAKDRLGNPVVGNWSFTVAAPPVFSQITPEPASATGNNTYLSVKVADNSAVDPGSFILLVDGLPVEASFDPITGILSYNAQIPFLDGLHTIDVTATDMAGNQASTSWSYTVHATGPQITFADAGNTFTSASPDLKVTANSGIKLDNSGSTMTVDGQLVPVNFSYAGHWEDGGYELDPIWVVDSYNEGWITGTPPDLRDGTHTLVVKATDILGNTNTSQWSFVVNSSPGFLSEYPKNKAETVDNHGFSIKIADNDGVDTTSVAVYFDGGRVSAGFDPTTGLASYQPAVVIPDGPHTVKVSAKDVTGNTSEFTWSYTVQANGPDITFADNGKVYGTHNPQVTITLKSNVKIMNTTAVMTIDGQQIPAGFTYKGHMEYPDPILEIDPYYVIDSYKEGTLVHLPQSLSDGTHQMTVNVQDILGNISTKDFSFSVAQPPQFIEFTPADGTTANSKSPQISVVVSDPNGPAIDKASIRLVVDNNQMVHSVTDRADGAVAVTYTPISLAIDAFHNVSISASDTANSPNTASAAWKFYVNPKGEMPIDAQACGSCHNLNEYDKYVHTEGPLGIGVGNSSPTHFYGNSCDHCHGGYRDNTCGYCHGANIMPPWEDDTWVRPTSDPALAAGQDCTYCHSNANGGWVPSPYPANHFYWVNNMINNSLEPFEPVYPDLGYNVRHDILPIHKVDKGACNDCHSTYLTREHNRLDRNGSQITCGTCHDSIDPNVQQAIANNNLDCLACHTDADHEAVHVDGLDSNCQTCHKSTLSQEHLANPVTNPNKNYSCDSCHAGTSNQVKRSIASGNENCAACHTDSSSHNVQFADSVPSDIPLFSGYQWSLPMEASLFAGEPNYVSGYDAGQFVLSNRRADVSTGQIWSFYNAQMLAGGWTLISGAPADGAVYFSAEFSKGGRNVTVRCYNTELNDGTGPQSTGYRVEIWYKSI